MLIWQKQQPEGLTESLNKTRTRCKMEISAENAKIMTNSANGAQRDSKLKDRSLEQEQASSTKEHYSQHGGITSYLLDQRCNSFVISIFLYACE